MLSSVDLTHSEVRLHRIIESWGLTARVEMSYLRLGLFWIPLLHVRDWMQYMLEKQPRVLLGGYTLAERDEVHGHLKAFWQAYGEEEASHQVFITHGERLQQCLPYYLYLDEGRGYRKSPVMIITFEAVLGLETRQIFKSRRPGNQEDLHLAYLDAQQHTSKGSSLRTRFAISVLPHSWYRKTRTRDRSHVFHDTLEAIAKECESLFWQGFVDQEGHQWYGVLCRLKGDSPALAKAGRLRASFMNLGANRRMCHMCNAGLHGIPWEHVGGSAVWKGTLYNQRPWSQPGELLRIPFDNVAPEKLYRNDAFHVVKYGIGRHFTGSCLIVLTFLNTWPGPSNAVEARLERAYMDFRECCKNSLRACPNVKGFTREILHFTTQHSWPWAGWKGSDTMLALRWLVRLLRYGPLGENHPRPQASMLRTCDDDTRKILEPMLDGACALVLFFQIINKGGLWLSRADATRVMQAVDMFVSCYAFLAKQFFDKGENRFHLEPSLHLFEHMSVRIRTQLQKGSVRILSPATWLCEAGEDYIGKVARVSRRVSARLTSQRTLQRLLIQTHMDWKSLD